MLNLNEILEVWEEESNGDIRIFKWITFAGGRYAIGVQAAFMAFCLPRATLPVDQYTHFEVCIGDLPAGMIPDSWDRYLVDQSFHGFVPRQEIETFLTVLDKLLGMDRGPVYSDKTDQRAPAFF